LGVAFRSLADWWSALVIVKPKTVITWHRNGLRLLWTWKARHGQTRKNDGVPQLRRDFFQANVDIADKP